MSIKLKLALASIGVAAIALLAAPLFRIERQASALLRGALPDYTCAPVYLNPTSGRYAWSGAYAYSSGSLQVPQACFADFAAQVRSSRRFAQETCNGVRSCWGTTEGSHHITLDIRPDVVVYYYNGKLSR